LTATVVIKAHNEIAFKIPVHSNGAVADCISFSCVDNKTGYLLPEIQTIQ
jgi:hypothetical protein